MELCDQLEVNFGLSRLALRLAVSVGELCATGCETACGGFSGNGGT